MRIVSVTSSGNLSVKVHSQGQHTFKTHCSVQKQISLYRLLKWCRCRIQAFSRHTLMFVCYPQVRTKDDLHVQLLLSKWQFRTRGNYSFTICALGCLQLSVVFINTWHDGLKKWCAIFTTRSKGISRMPAGKSEDHRFLVQLDSSVKIQ